MLGGIQQKGSAALNAGNAPVTANNPLENTTGVAASGGYLNEEKDSKTKSTDAKFGDVLNNIQAKYGAKPEKPREIKKELGKDDFLRIMISQMQHQDPTKPFDAQQMAQQMAQYASVEQLSNVNKNLVKMQQQTSSSDRMAMTGMIGKNVTVDRERFPHLEGTNESLSFVLPKDASEAKVSIISETGEPIVEKDLGPLKAGENNFAWDGLKSNTLPAKGGTFIFRISAKDARGMTIQTNPQSMARVIGVSFEGQEPVFLIGDARHQDKITLKNIVRIEDTGAAQIPGAVPMPGLGGPAPAAAGRTAGPAIIGFQKGEGSATLNPNEASPEVADAIAKFQQQQAANAAGEEKAAETRKQFGADAPSAAAQAEAEAAELAARARAAALGEEQGPPQAGMSAPSAMSRSPQANMSRVAAAIGGGGGGFPNGLSESGSVGPQTGTGAGQAAQAN
jgi:flagellar basal-body rod modification protein FlgD